MAFSLKPRLSGENSIITALATAGLVFAIYNMKLGPVADLHATDANDPNMRASIKKAGWAAVLGVGAMTLLAGDLNIAILGGGAIIYEELTNRHALMASPSTGQITVTPASYQPMGGQVQPVGSTALSGFASVNGIGASGMVEAQAG